MPPIEDAVRHFLERYGTALSTGDVPIIVACWDMPALVMGEEGARPVSTLAEVEVFSSTAVGW